MQRAAVFHRGTSPWVYPLTGDSLRLVLTTAAGDAAAVACIFNHRHAPAYAQDPALPMVLEATDGDRDYWSVTLPAPRRQARYLFRISGVDGEVLWLSDAGLHPERPGYTYFHYAYIDPAERWTPPAWLFGRTFYTIFVDRFWNGDPANDPEGVRAWGAPVPEGVYHNYGGDLAGLRQRLSYLDDLGVGGLYMTPILQSPTNHKYDTTDYMRIDPQFGSNAELAALVADCEASDMRVLLDAVFNHAGDTWFAFQDVIKRGAESPYVGWFSQIDSFPVSTEACNYETFSINVPSMPKLNTANPELAEYLLGVAEYWTRTAGIHGWRLDVANEVSHGFWRRFRDRVRAIRPDAWTLGELWHDSLDWLQGDQFDSVMHYLWRDAVLAYLSGRWEPSRFAARLTQLRYLYPWPVLANLLHLLGSHDSPRIRTVLGGSLERAGQAAILLLTAHGVPAVYYGDEVGMEGGTDPDCRRCMVWEPSEWAGDLRGLHRRLIRLRRRLPWLAWGGWTDLLADDARGLYAYRRDSGGPMAAAMQADPWPAQALWVALNTGGEAAGFDLEVAGAPALLVDLVTMGTVPVVDGAAALTLPAGGAAVLVASAAADLVR